MSAKVYDNPNHPLAINWWALGLRGVVAILFGILTFVWPAMTVAYLVFLFAFYALFDGIFNIVAAFQTREGHDRWWALLLVGVIGIVAAVVTFMYPGITALTLLYFIAAWAIWSGIFQIVAAVRLRKQITGEWLLIAAGVLYVLFGLMLIMAPVAGALAVLFWIGSFAIVSGILLLVLAFRVRSSISPRADQPGALRHA